MFYAHQLTTLALTLCASGATFLGSPAKSNDGQAGLLDRLILPKDCSQVAFVTADDWNTKLGAMRLYEKKDNRWIQLKDAEWHVDLGCNGMAWGLGLMQTDGFSGPHKFEGDGKSPAGVYELGEAFGYAEQAPDGCRLPYRQATGRDFFVDDPDSPNYNTWVRIDSEPVEPEKRWKSFERMRLSNDLYKWGIVVKHNMSPIVAGKGCAIFIHLWGSPGSGTAGCTAMTEDSVLKLLRWLDPNKHPLLVQFPWSAMVELQSATQQATGSNKGGD
jgi:D-alanyl-D-alanine dipeptidase